MRRVWLAGLCIVGLATSAAAQSNVEVNAGVQLDFQSPGARSLAMGSAFIGVADDATAAFVNPAGLRALSRREISFEGRSRGFDIPVAVRGRFGATLPGPRQGVDTIDGLIDEDQSQSAAGLSFLSFVYPRTRWAVAAYRHELANFDSRVQTEGPFFTAPDGNSFRRFPIVGTMDLQIVTYGISGSFNVSSQLSIGAGIAFYDFSMESRTDRYAITRAPFTTPPFFGAANFTQANLLNYQLQEGDDSKAGFNVGAIWAPNSKFQLGTVFRQGPSFDLRVANIDAATNQPFTAGDDRRGKFNVPNFFGVGAAVRAITNTTITVDVTRVQYSRLTDDFIDIFNLPAEAEPFSISDGTELHAGVEYVIPRRYPLAIRAGYWFDPEHALQFEGSPADSDILVFKSRDQDQQHATFGAGVVFGRFEINLAGDIAKRTKVGSVSAVVRF